jgi:hypothetical protein
MNKINLEHQSLADFFLRSIKRYFIIQHRQLMLFRLLLLHVVPQAVSMLSSRANINKFFAKESPKLI